MKLRMSWLAIALLALASIAAASTAAVESGSADSAVADSVTAGSVGWRMDGDGKYPETQSPTSWSTTSENVVWKTALPEWSNASPVLLSEKSLIFVLSEPDEIYALRVADGEIVWRESLGDVSAEEVGAHQANGWTSATPVSDGAGVFTVLGSGVVAGHDIDGTRRWARLVQQPVHKWGHSASPVLGGGNLIVHLVDLIALDPTTGKEVWRAESEVTWGAPVVTRVGDTEVVITPGGDVFRADTGKQVASGIGKLSYAAPVIQDGVIYFVEKKATAVKLPAALDEPFETLWESRVEGSRHYASSLIHEGLVYAVSREEIFSILDAATGELLAEKKLDLGEGSNSAYPSLAMAGGKLYVSVENGTTAVLKLGRTYEEIARSSLVGFRSSPIFAGKRMYIRAFDGLWCFETKG